MSDTKAPSMLDMECYSQHDIDAAAAQAIKNVREEIARMAEEEADTWHQRLARAIGRVPPDEADRMRDRAEMFRAFAAQIRARIAK